jgi:diphthamide biosynthesis methyltransferase
MFYLIGLGLGDVKDITVKGLEIIKKCDRVYLEAYTSILTTGKDNLVSIFIYIILKRQVCKYIYVRSLFSIN